MEVCVCLYFYISVKTVICFVSTYVLAELRENVSLFVCVCFFIYLFKHVLCEYLCFG